MKREDRGHPYVGVDAADRSLTSESGDDKAAAATATSSVSIATNVDAASAAAAAAAATAAAAAAAAANDARLLDVASTYSSAVAYPPLYAFPTCAPAAGEMPPPPYWPPTNGVSPGAYPTMHSALGMQT